MWIDVVHDAGRADHVMVLAFHAQRMLVEEGLAFGSPALGVVERARHRIAGAIIVMVALTLSVVRTFGADGCLI